MEREMGRIRDQIVGPSRVREQLNVMSLPRLLLVMDTW